MPAGASTAKVSEAAHTGTATAASPSATPGVSQQVHIIGVRTLLEFVAWLVCASLKDSSASTAQGKLRGDASPAGPPRRGAAFLTEELSSVGVAVRRMQVSNCLPITPPHVVGGSVCSVLSGQSDTCHDRSSRKTSCLCLSGFKLLEWCLQIVAACRHCMLCSPSAVTACAP